MLYAVVYLISKLYTVYLHLHLFKSWDSFNCPTWPVEHRPAHAHARARGWPARPERCEADACETHLRSDDFEGAKEERRRKKELQGS